MFAAVEAVVDGESAGRAVVTFHWLIARTA
jgi:hypothetical protein